MMIEKSRAYQYALWCVREDNRLVGVYVKKQAQLWIDIVDEKDSEAYIDEKQFRKITKIPFLINFDNV